MIGTAVTENENDTIQEDYMNDYTKPPLGASPAYISAENRIKELAEAISRASVEGRNYIGHITLWAKEIIWQCEIMQKSEIERRPIS
jgi:hypothetical protein